MTSSLSALLGEKKLIVCVGSGGVGKTTSSAALGIAAARMGKKAIVITIDPARRLAQALGVSSLTHVPSALDAAFCAPGSCDAMMLHAGEALDAFVAKLLPDEARRKRLFENRLYQVVARQLGGTHEYMAVERLHAFVRESDYDIVVLDTPPTANALQFLDAPNRLSAFFSDKITAFFLRQTDKDRGLFQRLKDRAGEVALAVLGKALGDGFVEELVDFSTAFQGLFQGIHDRAIAAHEILRAPSTAFLIISGADPVRTAEADVLLQTLRGLQIRPAAFIANRVHVRVDDAATASFSKKAVEAAHIYAAGGVARTRRCRSRAPASVDVEQSARRAGARSRGRRSRRRRARAANARAAVALTFTLLLTPR
jgi:anion-transporting  ArsA/GET3 family ATPase